MSSADWLGRQTSFAGACTRLHDALAAAGAKAVLEVDYPLDRRPEVRLVLAHDEVVVLAEIVERYVAWAKATAPPKGEYVAAVEGRDVAHAPSGPEIVARLAELADEDRQRASIRWVAGGQ